VPSATSRGGESLHVASLLANPMATGSQDRSLSQRPSVCKDGRAVPAASSASEIAASRHGLTVLEHQADILEMSGETSVTAALRRWQAARKLVEGERFARVSADTQAARVEASVSTPP